MKTRSWPPVFKKSLHGPWMYEYRVVCDNFALALTTTVFEQALRTQIDATVRNYSDAPFRIQRRVVGEWEDGVA